MEPETAAPLIAPSTPAEPPALPAWAETLPPIAQDAIGYAQQAVALAQSWVLSPAAWSQFALLLVAFLAAWIASRWLTPRLTRLLTPAPQTDRPETSLDRGRRFASPS